MMLLCHQTIMAIMLLLPCRGDIVEAAFYSNLIEDKTSAGTSYVDYLVAVHRSISSKNQ